MKNANVLGEATAVDSDHDPGVGQQDVGLLKEAHVFVPEVRQSSPTRSCRRSYPTTSRVDGSLTWN
jgi:hypothetical protein